MSGKLRRPHLIGFLNGWRWHLRHCWLGYLRRPVRFDNFMPAYMSISVLGFMWFFDHGESRKHRILAMR